MPFVLHLALRSYYRPCDEVPRNVNQPRHLSDSAPLLNGPQQNSHEPSTSKSHVPGLDSLSWNGNNHDHELRMNVKHANSVRDQNENFSDGPGAVLVNLLTSLRHLPPGMHPVLVVMALTWLSWFPFFLFDVDWMGKEVYHGDPKGNSNEVEFFMIKESEKITYSVPFSVTAELPADSGGGQGLAIGFLNLAIVIPQVDEQIMHFFSTFGMKFFHAFWRNRF